MMDEARLAEIRDRWNEDDHIYFDQRDADRLLGYARTDVPDLLAEVERLRQSVLNLEALVAHLNRK